AGGDASAGTIVDLHPRPAELLDAAVLPDAGAVVERPEALLVLLDDHDDAEVVERHRHVEPPHPLERRIVGAARRLGLADRPDTPRAVAGADPHQRVDGDLLAVDQQLTAPGAHLRQPPRAGRDSVAPPHEMWLFLDDVEQAFPGQIRRDAF